MKFKCDNCGKETRVGKLAVNLVCQNCGGMDIRFDTSISAFPILAGNELGKEIIIKREESFFGQHSQGCVWKIEDRKDLDVVIEDSIPKGEEIQEKAGLVKAVRKLKNPISK